MRGEPDPTYVQARRLLLDALEALQPHHDALVLVGAQAIYQHVGEATIAVAPFTTDGDIAVIPSVLGTTPALDSVMKGAGFQPGSQPGIWKRREGSIDLLVPQSVGGRKGRSASLDGHGASSALLVSKVFKLRDRLGNEHRLFDKDALDAYRLFREVGTGELVEGFGRMVADARVEPVARDALPALAELFGTHEAEGVRMIARALEVIGDPEEAATSVVILAQDLLAELRAAFDG
ncbi:MAG TPA: hypothetical protein VGB83_07465 [Actinomycetota bacterium]